MTKVTLFKPGTNVRRTGEIRDDNIVWNIAEAGSKFEALHQSEGDRGGGGGAVRWGGGGGPPGPPPHSCLTGVRRDQ